uniref:(northern house mosquito) hypothetical protein n=1 Tax=Culex pipiens TaxID=7175 RepID=A0A8D8FQ25_CULPI
MRTRLRNANPGRRSVHHRWQERLDRGNSVARRHLPQPGERHPRRPQVRRLGLHLRRNDPHRTASRVRGALLLGRDHLPRRALVRDHRWQVPARTQHHRDTPGASPPSPGTHHPAPVPRFLRLLQPGHLDHSPKRFHRVQVVRSADLPRAEPPHGE